MAIRSGIGFGAAQVYNQPSALVNTYGKVLAQQAKDRAKFEEDLAATMAKYSTKGLKDGDIKLTTEAYKSLKDKVTKYDSNNPTQRAQALAEARAGMQTIQDYADGAMTAYANLDKIGGDILENPWKYKDESVTAVKQLYANPYATWSDEYKDLNRAKFEREVDGTSVQKLFNVVNADLKGQAEAGNQFNVGQKGGYKIATYFATPEQASQTILKTMDLAPESKYTLTKAYEAVNPDKKDYTQLDVANFATQLYKEQFGPNALSFKGNMTLIPKPTGDGTPDWLNNPNPVTLNIPYASGKASVNGQNYIALSLPNKNFAGSNAIDLTTGSPVKSLKSSNDYQVVGIANFPTIASGKLAGSLAQPNYESKNQNNISYQPYIHVQQAVKVGSRTINKDLLVPFDRLPENVKSSKTLQKIIGNFRPSSGAPKGNSGSGKGNTDPLNILNP
jgi:hypothetical protein